MHSGVVWSAGINPGNRRLTGSEIVRCQDRDWIVGEIVVISTNVISTNVISTIVISTNVIINI